MVTESRLADPIRNSREHDVARPTPSGGTGRFRCVKRASVPKPSRLHSRAPVWGNDKWVLRGGGLRKSLERRVACAAQPHSSAVRLSPLQSSRNPDPRSTLRTEQKICVHVSSQRHLTKTFVRCRRAGAQRRPDWLANSVFRETIEQGPRAALALSLRGPARGLRMAGDTLDGALLAAAAKWGNDGLPFIDQGGANVVESVAWR